MQTAAHKSSEKKPAAPVKQQKKPGLGQAVVQREINPMWHTMAAHSGAASTATVSRTTSRAPTISKKPAGVALLQRMCAECAQEEQQPQTQQVQAELSIGAPDDPYEREADQVAEQVVQRSRYGSSSISPTRGLGLPSISNPAPSVVQRMCQSCANPQKEAVQKKESKSGGSGHLSLVRSVISGGGSGGSSVSDHVRSQTEPVLGADLSKVKVFSGAQANQAADSISAKAFTHGNGIYLGSGQSPNDIGLMAHELTHTVQQGASPQLQSKPTGVSPPEQEDALQLSRVSSVPAIQKIEWPDVNIPSPGDVWDAAESVYDTGSELAGDAYDAGSELAGDAYDAGSELAGEAYDAGAELASDAYEAGSELASDAYDAASDIASEMWDTARAIAAALGGSMSLSGGRLTIVVPAFQACPTMPLQLTLPTVEAFIPVLAGTIPIPPNIVIYGALGVNLALTPELSAQLGPCFVHGLRLVIDPLRGNYSAVGRVSVTTAFGLGAEASVGVRGEVGAIVVLPTAPPIPLKIPGVGLEAGIAGQARAISVSTTDLSIAASFSGGGFSGTLHGENDAGLALDLGLGAYGQLDVLGINLCRLYWPLYELHAQRAVHYSVDAALSINRSGFAASLSMGGFSSIPFDTIPMELNRDVLSDDCVLLEALCAILHRMGWMPSLSGGRWRGHPTPAWTGPLDIFPRDPKDLDSSFMSRAKCRGACGADCDTCTEPEDKVECVPTEGVDGQAGHDLWVYPNYQECDSHQGCRDHDGCYDWCGSGGPGGLGPMLCRRLCDIECMCDYRPSQCAGWVFGGAPHDRKIVFSDQPYIGGSCSIPCPAGAGAGGSDAGAPGSGGGNPDWGGGSSGGGGAGSSVPASGGGSAHNYSICLPTLELFGRLPWQPDPWSEVTPDYTIWSQWIELPPPVFLGNLKLYMNGYANAQVGAGIGPATVNNVCFGVDATTGDYLATGTLSIEADISAQLGVGGNLCTKASWLGLVDVADGCVGLEAMGRLSLRANLDGVLQRSADMNCENGKPQLATDLGFLLNALLDFEMDATFRLTTLFGIEIYSTRWNLARAQWAENWGQELTLNKNPFGDPTVDLRSHRFTLSEIGDLLVWLFSDDAEEKESDPAEQKTLVEDPLTAAKARTIPSINSRLDIHSRSHPASSLSLIGGASDTVGMSMFSLFITDATSKGSPPGSAQSGLYGYDKLPTRGSQGSYSSRTEFIKGHLLNYNASRGLGGEGIESNLFPITGYSNTQDHEKNVEKYVKILVHDDHLVVRYEVSVDIVNGPIRFDALEDDGSTTDPCYYQYVDANFNCRWMTYRLYSDDSVETNTAETHTVQSRFDLGDFKTRAEQTNPKCPQKP